MLFRLGFLAHKQNQGKENKERLAGDGATLSQATVLITGGVPAKMQLKTSPGLRL